MYTRGPARELTTKRIVRCPTISGMHELGSLENPSSAKNRDFRDYELGCWYTNNIIIIESSILYVTLNLHGTLWSLYTNTSSLVIVNTLGLIR